jgi:hypothetical protein
MHDHRITLGSTYVELLSIPTTKISTPASHQNLYATTQQPTHRRLLPNTQSTPKLGSSSLSTMKIKIKWDTEIQHEKLIQLFENQILDVDLIEGDEEGDLFKIEGIDWPCWLNRNTYDYIT